MQKNNPNKLEMPIELLSVRNLFKGNATIGIAKYLISSVLVMIIGTIIILITGGDPADAFKSLIKGSFGSVNAIADTIRWTTPSIITGIAAIIAFKSGVVNLGISGQLYFGAYICAYLGYELSLARPLHILVCILAAGLIGMVYALIPALMRMFLGIDEIISTLMQNYIAILLTEYMLFVYMGFEGTTLMDALATNEILPTAKLNIIIDGTQANSGIYIAVGIVIIVYLVYKYTVKGYELRQVGENLKFAKFGGVNAGLTYISIFLISGFIAGVSGALEVMGPMKRFRTGFTSNLAWDGIMIASIANNNPIMVLVVSIIWGALKAGSLYMELTTSTNRLVITFLQALFVLFIAIDYGALFEKISEMLNNKKKTHFKEAD